MNRVVGGDLTVVHSVCGVKNGRVKGQWWEREGQ